MWVPEVNRVRVERRSVCMVGLRVAEGKLICQPWGDVGGKGDGPIDLVDEVEVTEWFWH